MNSAFPIWNPQAAFPSAETMPDLDQVTHVCVERAQPGGFHYLHESAIAWHGDGLHLGWANHPLREINTIDERLRGRQSHDGGLTWSPAADWVVPPYGGSASYNHPVIAVHDDRLWGFFTRWDNDQPSTEIFIRNAGAWESTGARIPGFLPFGVPRRMRDGNWIISGELGWYMAAVAISRGDDFTAWETVAIPSSAEIQFQFPETTLIEQGDRLVAFCRPKQPQAAPVACSLDCGRTWSTFELSNFPIGNSKPLAARLSTGQQYLISNNLEQGRALLTIAVTQPAGTLFEKIWKIRHQQFPLRRLFGGYGTGSQVDQPTEWSYPAAVEHAGNLYVSYTQGKEDCCLSIIPLRALAKVGPV